MEIVHVVENLDDTYGGPARSVPNLAARTRALRHRVQLFSVAWSAKEHNDVIERERLPWHRFDLVGPRQAGFSPDLFLALLGRRTAVDAVIHLHNLWNAVALAAYLAAARNRTPLVVSPRGALYDWSLSQGRVRKLLALGAFQKRALNRAAFVHVTDALEARRVRELGIRAPIALLPNCIEQVPRAMLERLLAERVRRAGHRRTFLFLSRVHKKKGIDLLLRAWSRSQAMRSGGLLQIVGPTAPGYQRMLDVLVGALDIGGSVEFVGMVRGEDREERFREADVFVLPSHTENFGVVIGEALARGLPVLTTTGTPWEAVREQRAGWWIDLSLDNLVAALDDAATCSRDDLRAMGERGAAITRAYECDQQAAHMASAYEWIRGGARPPFLHTAPQLAGT